MIGGSGVTGAPVHFSHHCQRSPAQRTVRSLPAATPPPCPGHVRCKLGPRSAHFAPRTGTSHALHGVRRHPAACAVGLRGMRGHPAWPDLTRLPGLIGAIRTPVTCPAHPGAARGDLGAAARDLHPHSLSGACRPALAPNQGHFADRARTSHSPQTLRSDNVLCEGPVTPRHVPHVPDALSWTAQCLNQLDCFASCYWRGAQPGPQALVPSSHQRCRVGSS
jgi:hypothetical protein